MVRSPTQVGSGRWRSTELSQVFLRDRLGVLELSIIYKHRNLEIRNKFKRFRLLMLEVYLIRLEV